MKVFTVYVLAISLLIQSFGIVWVFAGFYTNRSYLAENKCIFRYEKINTCKGECVLVKQLQTIKETEAEKTTLKFNEEVVLSLPQTLFSLSFPTFRDSEEISPKTPHLQHPCLAGFTKSILRPPIV